MSVLNALHMLKEVAVNGKVKEEEQVQLHSLKGTLVLLVNENNLAACNCTHWGGEKSLSFSYSSVGAVF